ncbi:MAG: histidinol-phosphate transaminase [Tunicatimonas sp.]|uniref:pyridoxal phosphate-dependent aminotransferase n=1 Tax=Tunicatimonas sp. TaxID=1940096 RepID=UPI003C724BA0
MSNNLTTSRRNWLKQGALFAGGLVSAPALLPKVQARPAFGMTPYQGAYNLSEYHIAPPDFSKIKVRLLANENPYGPSPKAIQAIAESASKGNRYVYSSSRKMEEMLAEKEGVKPENILLAPGSTDILEKTAVVQCMNGGNVISADPAYMSLVKTSMAVGATWKNIPLKADFAHDLDAMAAAVDSESKLVYICNPNNPTGTITPSEDIMAFSRKVAEKVPIFIDEAYIELAMDPKITSAVGLVKEGKDVIIARTFSKLHGMAGLRIGYMVAQPERVQSIKDMVRTEMGISVTSMEGAMASMADTEFQEKTMTLNQECREYVMGELKSQGFEPYPSYTSFILFPIDMPTEKFMMAMVDKGIGIRTYNIFDKPHCRVSMGTMEEVKQFTSALAQVHDKGTVQAGGK